MLAALSEQLNAPTISFQETPELIVLYDPDSIDRDDLQRFVTNAIHPDAELEVRFEAAEDCEYYQQKNRGATLATRSWLLFVDSDVVPEPEWLENLLTARSESNAVIVGGETYVETKTAFERAFAVFWFFPQRQEGTGLYQSERFFANNFVVERETFLANPFPNSQLVRGQCYLLASRLKDRGLHLDLCRSARVSHPPPNGGVHFVKRALVAGHDFWMMDLELGPEKSERRSLMPIRRAKYNLAKAFRNVGRKTPELKLSFVDRQIARVLAVSYYGLAALGESIAPLMPKTYRDMFKV